MKKIAFLFPGQGSQYAGMGREICRKFKEADRTFEEAGDALGFDLKKLCIDGGEDELAKTANTQPALLSAGVAAFRVFMKETGAAPFCFAGHSIGEITALCCAGAIGFRDAVRLVRQRGKLMQEASRPGAGGMDAVIGLDQETVERVCSEISKSVGTIVAANCNSPEQTVISGSVPSLKAAALRFREMGAYIVELKVSAPFHSPFMGPAAEKFREAVTRCSFKKPKWPVISNVTAMPYGDDDDIADVLVRQMTSPVRWCESMDYLKRQGVDTAVEMGPKNVLKNLMKKNAPEITTFSYFPDTDMEEANRMFAGEKANSADGMGVITKCIAIAVCTRNRNWNNDEYQKGVVESYRKLTVMKDKLQKAGDVPTIGQQKEALTLLNTIFTTKKVPDTEQKERFREILDCTGTMELFKEYIS